MQGRINNLLLQNIVIRCILIIIQIIVVINLNLNVRQNLNNMVYT